jgi:hypothetical protein
LKFFIGKLGADFSYNTNEYEYEKSRLSLDLINGTDKLRLWYEDQSLGFDVNYLNELENLGRDQFLCQRKEILIYY